MRLICQASIRGASASLPSRRPACTQALSGDQRLRCCASACAAAAQPEDLDVKMPWVHGMSWIQEPGWPFWRLPKEKGGEEEEDEGRAPYPTWVGDKCAHAIHGHGVHRIA